MHSHRRSRVKVLFEALCAFGLAASFAAAWDQIGAPAFLASASITGLFAIYWSFGLFARDRSHQAEQPGAVVAAAPAVAPQVEVEPVRREEVLAREPEVAAEPEPVAKVAKKPRARKTKKAAADAVPAIEQAEPPAYADSAHQGLPLEPLFEPQPFARQPRAFGRKSRGPRNLSAA
jgi:hypothetical protein